MPLNITLIIIIKLNILFKKFKIHYQIFSTTQKPKSKRKPKKEGKMINIEEFVCTYGTGNNTVNSEPIKAATTFRKKNNLINIIKIVYLNKN